LRRPLLVDGALAAAVALLVFQGLRYLVGDRYQVTSASMAPVLYGAPVGGDVVFVDKLADPAGRRRGELVVVQHPEQPGGYLVKRIAACGDEPGACWIDLRDGDVWLGPDRQRLERVCKAPLAALAETVAWATFPGAEARLDLAAAARSDERLRLSAFAGTAAAALAEWPRETRRRAGGRGEVRRPAGFVGTARDVDATFVARDGRPVRSGDDQGVLDCGLVVDFAAVDGEVLVVHESRREVLGFAWVPRTGAVQVWRDGEVVQQVAMAARTGAVRLRCGLLDDQLYLCLDDDPQQCWVWPRPPAWDGEARWFGGPRTHLHLGVGGGAAEVTQLTVCRDLYVFRERIAGMPGEPLGWPRYVAPGHWFLLGDNSFDSRDSRHFDAVASASFVGRPLAVLAPASQRRWLEGW
jgi:hypothetical protein